MRGNDPENFQRERETYHERTSRRYHKLERCYWKDNE